MCGLVGFCGKLESSDKDILKTLMILSTLRGEDSSGLIAVVAKDKEPITMKSVGSSFELFNTTPFDRLAMWGKTAMIGHTRKATVGGISRATAHPFSSPPFHGVHNGTLRNWRQLPGDTLATDSATLYDCFSRLGVRDTIEQLDGAYALVWYNEEDRTINFLRNKERTLFYCFADGFKKMFWASEEWMLHVAITRSTERMDNVAKTGEPVKYVEAIPEDEWNKVRVNDTGKAMTWEFEELKGNVKKPPVPFYQTGFQRVFGHRQSWDNWPLDEDPLDDDPTITQLPASGKPDPSVVESSNTSGSSNTAPKKALTSTDSQQRKPTLRLAHDNKSGGTAQSSVTDTSTASNLPADVVVGYRGDKMDAIDYSKTEEACAFCDRNVDFAQAQEGGIGRWIAPTRFICTPCHTSGQVAAC